MYQEVRADKGLLAEMSRLLTVDNQLVQSLEGLRQEGRLLTKFVYKNSNQHQSAPFFKGVLERAGT